MPSAPVAIVTAASKGMGAACARLLAQQGYHLALFARSSELSDLASELDAVAVTGDLADPAAIEQLIHQTKQRYGRIDAVVNNTGHAAKGDLLTLTDDDWHRGLDLLLLNVIRLARLVTPIMLAQQKSGVFVNISSFAAVEPGLRFPVSATIRAGLSAFTKLYVQQYGSRGLRMNNVLPGWIDTYPVSMEDIRQIPLGRLGTADDVARFVAFPVIRGRSLHRWPGPLGRWRPSARYIAKVSCSSNESMKSTAQLRNNFNLLAATPCRGLSQSR